MFRFPTEHELTQGTDVVTIHGVITEIDPNVRNHQGATHQIFSVQVDQVIANAAHASVAVGDIVNIAIRYGDSEGLRSPVPGLATGQSIALSGRCVTLQAAYPEKDGDRHAVIHYTHHPVGWVEYQGHHYE